MKQRQQNKILLEFREALYCLSASFAAGKTLEFALEDAGKKLALSFGDESILSKELIHISNMHIQSHEPVELLLEEFSKRSGVFEIEQFAMECSICRKSGADMEGATLKAALILLEKINFSAELKAVTAEKKLDLIVLFSMPILMLFFLNLSSEDYLAVLYTGLFGRLVMSVCLGLIFLALYISARITDIKL